MRKSFRAFKREKYLYAGFYLIYPPINPRCIRLIMILDKFEEVLKNCFEKSTFLKMGNLQELGNKIKSQKLSQSKPLFCTNDVEEQVQIQTNGLPNGLPLSEQPTNQWIVYNFEDPISDPSSSAAECFPDRSLGG